MHSLPPSTEPSSTTLLPEKIKTWNASQIFFFLLLSFCACSILFLVCVYRCLNFCYDLQFSSLLPPKTKVVSISRVLHDFEEGAFFIYLFLQEIQPFSERSFASFFKEEEEKKNLEQKSSSLFCWKNNIKSGRKLCWEYFWISDVTSILDYENIYTYMWVQKTVQKLFKNWNFNVLKGFTSTEESFLVMKMVFFYGLKRFLWEFNFFFQ